MCFETQNLDNILSEKWVKKWVSMVQEPSQEIVLEEISSSEISTDRQSIRTSMPPLPVPEVVPPTFCSTRGHLFYHTTSRTGRRTTPPQLPPYTHSQKPALTELVTGCLFNYNKFSSEDRIWDTIRKVNHVHSWLQPYNWSNISASWFAFHPAWLGNSISVSWPWCWTPAT